MNTQRVGLDWLQLAAIYFSLAVLLGLGMGMSGNHRLLAVHAHLNLLGWVSMALIGLIYRHFPAAGQNRLARVQFWLHNLGLPVMMVALTFMLLGHPQVEPVVGISSLVVAGGVVLFCINLLMHARNNHE
jgi:hypothetical protein